MDSVLKEWFGDGIESGGGEGGGEGVSAMERSNLTFLKQAARGARPERGEPIAPHPTTRGQFQRTHLRGRAWPGGGARELRASPFR